MAQQKTESMDKAVHCEIMRLLRERVNDPTDPWEWFSGLPQKEWVAGDLLKGAYYLVVHQFWIDGYKDFNFMRASAVVKRQSTFMAS